jgi:hypothetical protein
MCRSASYFPKLASLSWGQMRKKTAPGSRRDRSNLSKNYVVIRMVSVVYPGLGRRKKFSKFR